MKKFIALLCLLSLSLLAGEKLLYVNSVDRPLDQDWRLTKGDVTMEQVPWPDGESGLTAKFTYMTRPDGWPSAKYYLPAELKDWRSARRLFVEIYCTKPVHVGLVVATDTDKKTFSWTGLDYAEGRHTIEVNVTDMRDYDLSCVKYIDFFASRPTEPHDLYVGDIRLEMADPEAEAAQHKAQAKVLRNSLQWRLSAIDADLPDVLQALIAQLSTLPEIPDADAIRAFQKTAKEVYPVLDKLFFQKAVQDCGLAAFWCRPEDKVLRDAHAVHAFLTLPAAAVTLGAARGEGEGTQLVVYAPQKLNAVRAELVAAPAMADGTTLPLEAIKLAPMGYVLTENPAYPVDYIGYWPDPILEYLQTPIPVDADTYQSWWMDIQVPHDQKSGNYTGSVRITTEKGEAILPFSLTVFPFELAHGVPYFSPVQFDNMPNYPADPEERYEYRLKIGKLLIDHRLQPDEIYRGFNRDKLVETSKALLDYGAPAFNLGFVNKEMDDEYFQQIADAYQKCKEAGILDKAYIYCFDECPAAMFPMIKKTMEKVREAAPGVPIYTTIYDSSFGIASDLDELIDCWIPLTTVYGRNEQFAADARARGRKVGWYVCCSPLSPYANFLLEYPATGTRLLMGFMNRKFKPDFFLYYNACVWREWGKTENGDYFIKQLLSVPVTGGPLLEFPWIGESFRNFSGDGRLLYPAADGPIPTQRLKVIRDGLDDWMYMDLLEKCLADADKMPETWKNAAKAELLVEDELVVSLTEWTQDPALVQAKRDRIAALLNQYFTR